MFYLAPRISPALEFFLLLLLISSVFITGAKSVVLFVDKQLNDDDIDTKEPDTSPKMEQWLKESCEQEQYHTYDK